MREFQVVIIKDSERKITLTVPALPGYIACGSSEEEVLQLAREGIPFHIECLRDEGLPIPEYGGEAKVVSVEVAA